MTILLGVEMSGSTSETELKTYYHDHWVEIDSERLQRYDKMFRVPPQRVEALLKPLSLEEGHRVLDFGCGPGFVSTEIARLVGPNGTVHAVDVNQEFVTRCQAISEEAGMGDRLTAHHLKDDTIPIEVGSIDRALAKNVLEYVPDASKSLQAIRRTLASGGMLAAVDSDWGFVVAEPFSPREVTELFEAAQPAFREPYIGRRLPGLFRGAGYSEVEVRVNSVIDRKGHLQGVIHNMLAYALQFGRLSEQRVTDYKERLLNAVNDGEYLFILPQFVVRGVKD